MVEEPNN